MPPRGPYGNDNEGCGHDQAGGEQAPSRVPGGVAQADPYQGGGSGPDRPTGRVGHPGPQARQARDEQRRPAAEETRGPPARVQGGRPGDQPHAQHGGHHGQNHSPTPTRTQHGRRHVTFTGQASQESPGRPPPMPAKRPPHGREREHQAGRHPTQHTGHLDVQPHRRCGDRLPPPVAQPPQHQLRVAKRTDHAEQRPNQGDDRALSQQQ